MQIMKRYLLVIIALVLSFSLCSCESPKDEVKSPEEFIELDPESTEAEGYDLIGGVWKVAAVTWDTKIVDVIESGLYDSFMITVNSDGKFVYMLGAFIYEGTYKPYDHPEGKSAFIFHIENMLDFEVVDGEFTEVRTPYPFEAVDDIMWIEPDGSVCYCEFDPITGKANAGEDIYYLITYDEYNALLNGGEPDSYESSKPEPEHSYGNSYEDIYNEYVEKMNEKLPSLVREYKSDAAGISDITKLADICNEKVGKLADICNEGVGEMADLMYENNDSYSTYEKWATKLMDEYTEIANEIFDAYLDSAM